MTELTDGAIAGMFQKQFDMKKRGCPILQVCFLYTVL